MLHCIDEIKKHLSYDPDTGIFIRLIKRARTSRLGEAAGFKDARGYIRIKLGSKMYRAHRLAWFWVNGEWPEFQIDHINGILDDNRISNLRDVTIVTNQQNQKTAHKNNKSGLLGVSPVCGNKYSASIRHNGRKIHLGRFSDPVLAHQAYLAAKRNLHKGCTI